MTDRKPSAILEDAQVAAAVLHTPVEPTMVGWAGGGVFSGGILVSAFFFFLLVLAGIAHCRGS